MVGGGLVTRRLRVVHRTGFRYSSPVAASYNEARMTPLTTSTQTALEAGIVLEPATWRHTFRDYWGTQVTAFDVLTMHQELAVVSSSTVEVFSPRPPRSPADWEVLRSQSICDTYVEYLTPTRWTIAPEEVAGLAAEIAGGLPPDEAARAVAVKLHELLDYVPGVTSVQTLAEEVWAARRGVCQDFAHVTVAALRSLGIPARYVSGYLHPKSDAEIGERVEGQSHAWVEWWVGEWVGFDPTHGAPTSVDHVLVARGRDYSDVTPLKGIYSGAATSELFVSVEVTRLA
jgi:transglutaminase-like putative cysteine protease